MVISSSDVEFSCGGNTITFSTSTSGRGLSLDAGVENVTISDCQIHQGSSSSNSYGLAVIGSTGSRMNDIHVRNVNVSTQGTSTNVGAYFLWVENSTVTNLNSTTVGGSFADAVWFGDSYNIEYDGGVVYSQNERGVSLVNSTGNSGNIRISNVNVSVDGSGTAEAAFYIDHGDVLLSNVRGVNPSANTVAMSVNLVGDNVTVTDSYLEGPSYPVFVQIAGTITFMNTELENRASGAMMRLYSDTGPLYARLINITTSSATMSWGGSATRRIYWGYWVDAYVNDTTGSPVSGASVDYLADVATNNPSASGTETTASDGTVRFPVYQYTQSPTATDQLNDYTFDASAVGYGGSTDQSYTVSDNLQINFTLAPLVVENVTLNATSPDASTNDNLTLSFDSLSAPDVTNVTDWRVNGASIALVNLPFDRNISTAGVGDIKDYSTNRINATRINGPVWTDSCAIGGCYEYDHVSDRYLELDNESILDELSEFSFSVWVYRSAWDVFWQQIWGKGDVLVFRRSSNTNVLRWDPRNATGGTPGLLTTTGINADTWYHLAGVYSESQGFAELYVNGVRESNGSVAGSIAADANPIVIGAHKEGAVVDQRMERSYRRIPHSSTACSVAEQIARIYDEQSAGRSISTIVSDETRIGDTWQAAVTAVTPTAQSDTVLSNTLAIELACQTIDDTGRVHAHEQRLFGRYVHHDRYIERILGLRGILHRIRHFCGGIRYPDQSP
jgi:hypothetical protein